jgi:hypothetical protein
MDLKLPYYYLDGRIVELPFDEFIEILVDDTIKNEMSNPLNILTKKCFYWKIGKKN